MAPYIHWNPDPEIVNLFGISIRYYGLFFVTGIILCIKVIEQIFKQEGIPRKNSEVLTQYGVLGIFVGARLAHCFFYDWDYYSNHLLEILLPIRMFPSGDFEIIGYQGLASHGGALGLILALFFYSRRCHHQFLEILDIIAITTGLGGGFIRISNFFNSEIIGKATGSSWYGVVFDRVDQIPRHPAQIYESLAYFFIFCLMIMIYRSKRIALGRGFYFGLTLSLIFCFRFGVEFFKVNQSSFEEGMALNMGQWLSIPYIIVGLGFVLYAWFGRRKMISVY
ncbi:prolipoprotein diacylglyceryl transferase [Persicobacter diffluens]|uniref:Phosphatidylglycerol--prolipoprotein diacylglyceryl transferase n=1 Tax=Persicobacter diffluens TaxID=981 RepID=A0AAN4VV82_9BACT|nr:prolipoprotein diacylglyceryl transferase [Persicobacter diffluens]